MLARASRCSKPTGELLPESIPMLEGAIATLKRYPDVNIEVAGHTDSRGSDAYNLRPVGATRRSRAQVPARRRRDQHAHLARLRRDGPASREQRHGRRPAAKSARRVAHVELTRLSANDETLIKGLIQQAERAQAAGQRDEAQRLLARAESISASHPLVLNARAIERLQSGDVARARELLERATQLEPRNATLWMNLATAFRGLNLRDEEEQTLRPGAQARAAASDRVAQEG